MHLRGASIADRLTNDGVEDAKGFVLIVLLRAHGGDSGDAGQELHDRLTRQAPGDEDQPRAPIAVGPVLELDRGMRDMLNKMDDNRSTAFRYRDEPFDAQEVGAPHSHQHRHRLFKAGPGEGFFENQ